MGSWSVYCNISNITITEGTPMYIVPLHTPGFKEGYHKWIPLTLPIKGIYDDYGRIRVEDNSLNIKLLEEAVGMSIDDFCELFTSNTTGGITEAVSPIVKKKDKYTEVEYAYAFIHGDVYDFMTTNIASSWGNWDFGKKEVLLALGFKYEGTEDRGRYNQKYTFNEYIVYTDGRWIEDGYYSFEDLRELGVDTSILERTTQIKEWRTMNSAPSVSHFSRDMDSVVSLGSMLKLLDFPNTPISKYGKECLDNLSIIERAYLKVVDEDWFKDELVKLVYMLQNMRVGSYTWNPQLPYLTPQCGEFEAHQALLDKFAEINRKNIRHGQED